MKIFFTKLIKIVTAFGAIIGLLASIDPAIQFGEKIYNNFFPHYKIITFTIENISDNSPIEGAKIVCANGNTTVTNNKGEAIYKFPYPKGKTSCLLTFDVLHQNYRSLRDINITLQENANMTVNKTCKLHPSQQIINH